MPAGNGLRRLTFRSYAIGRGCPAVLRSQHHRSGTVARAANQSCGPRSCTESNSGDGTCCVASSLLECAAREMPRLAGFLHPDERQLALARFLPRL
jgi:hypothetical protein